MIGYARRSTNERRPCAAHPTSRSRGWWHSRPRILVPHGHAVRRIKPLAARVGDHKLKFDPTSISRSVPEGKKGKNVDAPVMATGNHSAVKDMLRPEHYAVSCPVSLRKAVDC